MRRLLGASTEALIIVILVFGLLAMPVIAARGGGGAGGGDRVAAGGSCAVSPDPTAVGGIFTVTGSDLAPSRQVMVQIANAYGTQILFSSTDSSGVLAPASSYASWSGGQTVSVVFNARKPVTLTTCTFEVS